MDRDQSYKDIVLFAETEETTENFYSYEANYHHISICRNGRIQPLLNSCHYGYIIKCAPPPRSISKRSLAHNENFVKGMTDHLTIECLVLFIIAIVLLLFVKIIKNKKDKIIDLQREICKKSEHYGTPDNYI